MGNFTHLVSSWTSALPRPVGVAGDPYLAAGLVLGYFVLGLGSYIWAFWSQRMAVGSFYKGIRLCARGRYSQLTGVQNIYGFFKALMTIDAASTITALVLLVELFKSNCEPGISCYEVFFMWLTLRHLGVSLHVLNALACLLYLHHPQQAAKVRCAFTAVFVLTLLFFVACLVSSRVEEKMIFGMAAVIFGLAVAIVITCAVSTAPLSTAAHKRPVVVVAMVTVLFAFTPNFVVYTMLFISASSGVPNDTYVVAYVNVVFFTNLNLLLDGLLCKFILRVPVTDEEERQETIVFENYRSDST